MYCGCGGGWAAGSWVSGWCSGPRKGGWVADSVDMWVGGTAGLLAGIGLGGRWVGVWTDGRGDSHRVPPTGHCLCQEGTTPTTALGHARSRAQLITYRNVLFTS